MGMGDSEEAMKLFGIEHDDYLCPSCRAVASQIRRETLMPVPLGSRAPLSRRRKIGAICFDCAATEALMTLNSGLDFPMARIAVGNDRQEKLRLPGLAGHAKGIPMVKGALAGDLSRLQRWQKGLPPELGCDARDP